MASRVGTAVRPFFVVSGFCWTPMVFGTDERGRTIEAVGTTRNQLGAAGYGEDHDNWSMAGQRQFAREVESALDRLGLGPLSHRRP